MSQKPLIVVTPNPEQVVLTRNKPEFLRALQAADIRIPDGIGLIHASKILGWRYSLSTLTERLTGKAVVLELLTFILSRPVKVLVIGGRELGVSLPESDSLGTRGLCQLKSIKGKQGISLENNKWYWHEGYQQVSQPTPEEALTLQTIISQLKPDLVFVAFGAPDQELWIASHRELLQANGVKLAMVVGGAFDVLTGVLQPPPAWMEHYGLEWAFRLWQQPNRWRRQLRLFEFVGLVIRGCFNRVVIGL